jgi:hypothetical protein
MSTNFKVLGIIVLFIVFLSWYRYENSGTGTVVETAIESQFSSWDGSHTELVKMVKEHMHDPKSFEHVSTTFEKQTDGGLLVCMDYRGKNGFGATMLNNICAKYSVSGVLVEVVKE